LPNHEHVRTRDFAAIKTPDVIAKTSAKYVSTDIDAIAAKATFRYKGIGGLEMGGRHTVRRSARLNSHFSSASTFGCSQLPSQVQDAEA
jgi:hypothetical protein